MNKYAWEHVCVSEVFSSSTRQREREGPSKTNEKYAGITIFIREVFLDIFVPARDRERERERNRGRGIEREGSSKTYEKVRKGKCMSLVCVRGVFLNHLVLA